MYTIWIDTGLEWYTPKSTTAVTLSSVYDMTCRLPPPLPLHPAKARWFFTIMHAPIYTSITPRIADGSSHFVLNRVPLAECYTCINAVHIHSARLHHSLGVISHTSVRASRLDATHRYALPIQSPPRWQSLGRTVHKHLCRAHSAWLSASRKSKRWRVCRMEMMEVNP